MRNKVVWLIPVCLLVVITIMSACATPAATTQAPTSLASATTTAAPATTLAAPAKPQGELVAALESFGNENFLPWQSNPAASVLCCLVYDILLYWDEVNLKYIPGLAESWEVSPDAMTLTYHLRKGVQWQDGWGEFTSEDVKFNFEQHASPSSSGKTSQTRLIKNMETPDPYTLVVHFKSPYPTFYSEFSFCNGGALMGIACKKYIETAGEDVAAEKPIGTGPYKLVDSQLGNYYKFEALDSHWRVVPEFKTVILRAVPEISTIVAMLKTGEIDLANISSEQVANLKAAGLAAEFNPVGGSIVMTNWGAIYIPEDYRYKPDYHNKDPWVDMRVRKAMTIAIDRQAIGSAIFSGSATPIGVPLHSPDMLKYQYPFDPAAAKQLLAEAGYPKGFSFKLFSFPYSGIPEMPRVVEALAGYWQQIGLDPQINATERTVFLRYRTYGLNAGQIGPQSNGPGEQLEKAALFLMPGGQAALFEDEGSYAIWKEGYPKVDPDERAAYVDKLNQYYYENYGPIPLVKVVFSYAWNPAKISPFPHPDGVPVPMYLEYVRHAQPLNTFRLFTPFPGR